jgi:hypothetical protein
MFYQSTLRKISNDPTPIYALKGRLVASSSGWLLLEVPNAIVHGLFASLDLPGIELPLKDGRLNAHISVAREEELAGLGGNKAISETGKLFSFQLGPLKEVAPLSWEGVSKVWFVEVKSPELETLRKSYGLPPRPMKGDKELQFHITVAIRKTSVLRQNAIAKVAKWFGQSITEGLANVYSYAPNSR